MGFQNAQKGNSGLWLFYAADQSGKPLDVPVPALVQSALQRLFVLSLLYYAIVFSVRNFSAARHNMVVNLHRRNALIAFEAFVDSASADQQTKNAVLLQATKAIFDAQPSGFLKNDNDTPQPSSQVIEIFKAAASKP
jgi:hypothetical protein